MRSVSEIAERSIPDFAIGRSHLQASAATITFERTCADGGASLTLNGASNTGENRNPGAFVKGDARINRSGRPRSFDECRRLAQAIAHEVEKGHDITIAESILRSWAKSKNPILQRSFVEYAFGKVPDKLGATGLGDKKMLVLYYDHERAPEPAAAPNETGHMFEPSPMGEVLDRASVDYEGVMDAAADLAARLNAAPDAPDAGDAPCAPS